LIGKKDKAVNKTKETNRETKLAQNGMILVVSVSILKEDKVLLIKEYKPSAMNKWNFPSGRIEYGENILIAAKREVKEETGYEVKLIGTTGIYQFESNTKHSVILFHFTAEIIGGLLVLEEKEIIDSKWIKLPELAAMHQQDLRNAAVIKRIANKLGDKKCIH
jgi:8-oxo-dGTP diphosphatase